ncbi:AraC family transcriptional regulator [Mucilaginibacter sp. RB4R14]|uniref:AraC family transcriptional regulator n=1 Tax=Mucilaginibacter aurantiaciroseus TaxID=2949308 RepID=UPI00208FFC71|nr:AraC family transcriptional regulator [Mucilaginibacter aurantiaciroseus]MCO5933992.1 AraC family transcriptional regulator [Mucilaginibacter aurantiaciroseus]
MSEKNKDIPFSDQQEASPMKWLGGEHMQHNILYSCTSRTKRGHEQMVQEHSLGCIIAGEIHFYTNNGVEVIGEGSIGIIRKNQLAKTVKVPPAGRGMFKAINIEIDQQHLRKYGTDNNIYANGQYKGSPLINLTGDAFIKGYFDSLLPYFDNPDQLSKAMAEMKTNEAIELLLRKPGLRDFLLDFTEPFKIDLEAFMNSNFKYNIAISQFARLTGRSLATFKRDFQKAFTKPPERWLHQKRLELAHYLIAHKKQNPTGVYLEVGFENISHFSASFKKHFGYNPSNL